MLVETKRPRVRQQLNLPLFAATLLIAALLVPGLYFWHRWQQVHIADALLQRATQREQQKRWNEAAEYLYRYLQLVPDNDAVRIRLAVVFDSAADSPQRRDRAIQLYSQAVGVAPKRTDLRGRLAELLLQSQQPLAADQMATDLLALDPADAVGRRVQALARFALATAGGDVSLDEAAALVERVLSEQPGNIQLAEAYARLQRELLKGGDRRQRGQKADAAMQRLVTARPDDAESWLCRYRYRKRYHLAGAEADLQHALQIAPAHRAALLAAGMEATSRGQFEAARSYFERAIAVAPNDPAAHLGLGDSFLGLGDAAKAEWAWRRGLQRQGGGDLRLNMRLADLLIEQDRTGEARELLDRIDRGLTDFSAAMTAAQRNRVRASADLLQAKWYVHRAEWQQALPLLKRVASLSTPHSDSLADRVAGCSAWLLLARLYSNWSQWDVAARAYERAAEFDNDNAALRLQAALAWAQAGQLQRALAICRKLRHQRQPPAQLWPLLAQLEAQLQLANAPQQRDWRHVKEAIARGEQADPEAQSLRVLKSELAALRHQPDALAMARSALDQAIAAGTDDPATYRRLALLLECLGQHAEADRAVAQLRQRPGTEGDAMLVRAELLVRRGEVARARQVLAETARHVQGPQQPMLVETLASLERAVGELASARERLAAAVDQWPAALRLVQLLAEVALEMGDLQTVGRCEEKLRAIEGPAGSTWRLYRALRLVAGARGLGDPQLGDAMKLHAELEAQRPDWPATHLLGARIAELAGNQRDAVEAYLRAIRLGADQPAAVTRTAELLLSLGRHDQLMRLLAGRMPIDQSLGQQPLQPSLIQAAARSVDLTGFAAWLVRRGRLKDAIRLCQLAWDRSRAVSVAMALARALLYGSPDEEDSLAAEPLIAEALRRYGEDPRLLLLVGNLRIKQHRRDEAIRLLRRATQLGPQSMVAWNNLAALLAEQPETRTEALECIDQAIKLAGTELPTLLDTKATVLLYQDKAAEAARLLEQVVQNASEADPRFYFHLALAYHRVGAPDQMKLALQHARRLGLDKAFLTERELKQLAELEQHGGRAERVEAKRLADRH